MFNTDKILQGVPANVRNRIESAVEAVGIVTETKNPRVLKSMIPSAGRGFILRQGKTGEPVKMRSNHEAHFDFNYTSDFPEMADLYRRAKLAQWNGETQLDWKTSVDPDDPRTKLLPDDFVPRASFENLGYKLSDREFNRFKQDLTTWMLSQFLHGEQGALFAAAQVTESVPWFDGKFYGSTQVVDEGRHVEVFHRYLETKMEKMYQVNDNLFTIIDALMTDSRWDMKFLGMQIMIEGLALGAFGMMYKLTKEPLLKDLLKYVIQDEARHVHYGVLALHRHFKENLSEKELREREDWTFEVALLMRNRFMAHEVYEEWFSDGRLSRRQWNEMVYQAKGLATFRKTMFNRLVPNLKYIGLLSDRMMPHYEKAGMLQYLDGLNASQLSGDMMIAELDQEAGKLETA